MRTRHLAWLAWGLSVGSATLAIAIRALSRAPIPENRFQLGEVGFLTFGALTLAYATTALIIVRRRPQHPIGWILFATGGAYGLSAATAAITFHLLVILPPLAPQTLWAAWLTVIASSAGGSALFLLIWLFPDGRSPFRAPWFGPLVVVGVVGQIAWSFADRNWLFPTLPTPVALPGLVRDVVGAVGGPLLVAGAVVGALGMIAVVTVRARRSSGVERQQLKWFAYATVVAVTTLVIAGLAGWLIPGRSPLGEYPLAAFLLSTTAIPVAVAIAILRYRLYEIDRIIGRTLVYAALSSLLALIYGVGVIAMSALFAPLAGGDSLAVAAATLGVAGLFQPIRRRIQLVVDRRFYRARYDARQIAAGFAATLRDEVDVDRLSAHLRRTVHRAVEPASASVWLRTVRS